MVLYSICLGIVGSDFVRSLEPDNKDVPPYRLPDVSPLLQLLGIGTAAVLTYLAMRALVRLFNEFEWDGQELRWRRGRRWRTVAWDQVSDWQYHDLGERLILLLRDGGEIAFPAISKRSPLLVDLVRWRLEDERTAELYVDELKRQYVRIRANTINAAISFPISELLASGEGPYSNLILQLAIMASMFFVIESCLLLHRRASRARYLAEM